MKTFQAFFVAAALLCSVAGGAVLDDPAGVRYQHGVLGKRVIERVYVGGHSGAPMRTHGGKAIHERPENLSIILNKMAVAGLMDPDRVFLMVAGVDRRLAAVIPADSRPLYILGAYLIVSGELSPEDQASIFEAAQVMVVPTDAEVAELMGLCAEAAREGDFSTVHEWLDSQIVATSDALPYSVTNAIAMGLMPYQAHMEVIEIPARLALDLDSWHGGPPANLGGAISELAVLPPTVVASFTTTVPPAVAVNLAGLLSVPPSIQTDFRIHLGTLKAAYGEYQSLLSDIQLKAVRDGVQVWQDEGETDGLSERIYRHFLRKAWDPTASIRPSTIVALHVRDKEHTYYVARREELANRFSVFSVQGAILRAWNSSSLTTPRFDGRIPRFPVPRFKVPPRPVFRLR